MRLLIILGLIFFLHGSNSVAQTVERPRLVVGIVIDQMRFDYLYRYQEHFSKDGFLRLMHHGFSFENAHCRYMPTGTASGHATIYTGTTPSVHGIIADSWYDRDTEQMVYCVDDSGVKTVGEDGYAGERSPERLFVSTITDQLRMATGYRGKVVSIALDDRSAVLPGGHTAGAAYWFDSETGKFITSTYYMDRLPGWVEAFNARKLPGKYARKNWQLLLPDSAYTASTPDNEPWEHVTKEEDKPVFPHVAAHDPDDAYGSLLASPWGNQLIIDFAEAAVANEKLGQDNDPDFLAVSFATTDHVGQRYGTDAMETEDIYLRLDRQLAGLFHYLDQHVGRGNYLLFLTSDGGAAPAPEYLLEHNIPAGHFDTGSFVDYLRKNLGETYGAAGLLTKYANDQIYLNDSLLDVLGLNKEDVSQKTADWAQDFPEVYMAAASNRLAAHDGHRFPEFLLRNGDYPGRSGDVFVVYQPWFTDDEGSGIGSNSPYSYNTHIPLLFYGWHIPVGKSYAAVDMADIAPTLAAMLHMTEPNAATGRILQALFGKSGELPDRD